MRKKRDLNKFGIMITLLAVMVSMAGVAAAEPFDVDIHQASPNQATPAPGLLDLNQGGSVTLSLLVKNFNSGSIPGSYPRSATVACALGPGTCTPSDVVVTINPPGPVIIPSQPFILVDNVTVTWTGATDLDGTLYLLTVNVGPGDPNNEVGSASRTIEGHKEKPPCTQNCNRSEFWNVEWFNTQPRQYTEFLLPNNQRDYLITSGFVAPEARTIIWDDSPAPVAVKNGDRLKYWYANEGGDLYIHKGYRPEGEAPSTVRLYGTFDEGPGDLKAIDPATGLRPENPPYTDPISPFFPQANQSPRKDFITFNPALMAHNGYEGKLAYPLLKYYLNPKHEEVQSPNEKVFKRMWYEKEWFKDDYQGKADGHWQVIIETTGGTYVATVALDDEKTINSYLDDPKYRIREQNADITKGDTYAPAIKQEFAYMALDDIMMPIMIQNGSKIMIPMANDGYGKGLNSFKSVSGQGNDAVTIESEKTLGRDIDGDGIQSMDTDGKEVSGDESVVLKLDGKHLAITDKLQYFDNVVTLRGINKAPQGIRFDVCDNEGGGSQNCATNQNLDVGDVLEYQRGSQENNGPFYVKLISVDADDNGATIEVGRLFGNTLANIGKNPLWNEKAFIVQDVFYNIVGIKAKDDTFKYIVFREKLPKAPVKLYGKHLTVWSETDRLPEMPPFNMEHVILEDVVDYQTKPVDMQDKIGTRSFAGPLEIYYTFESIEERFRGELKQIYAESYNPYKEFWNLEWFHTKPDQFTEFVLSGGQKYLVTTGFSAPEAVTHIWDGNGTGDEKPIVKHGDRLKFWFDPSDGRGLFINNTNGAVRLYGTFDEGAGDLKAIDPVTGKRPENPPYTDPISPFFPQSPQSPRKDFVTFNPAIMAHNAGLEEPAYTLLKFWRGDGTEIQSPMEKVFHRMWYQKDWFKDDYKGSANGHWDVVIETQNGDYVTTIPLDDEQAIHAQLAAGNRIREQNNDENYGDTYAPAIVKEFAYMTLDDITEPVLVKSGSKIMIPLAHQYNVGGSGLNSFESVSGQGNDAVRVESEQTLGLDINNDGVKKTMDTDGIEVSGDESVVLVLGDENGGKLLETDQSLQFFDNVVTLRAATKYPAGIRFDICDNEGGTPACTLNQLLTPGQVLKYQRGSPNPEGPFYIKLKSVDVDNQATIEVGRLFGNTLANIGANTKWNEKAFMVDEVFYNVVGIKAKGDTFKYIVFREKLPKDDIKLYGKHLKVWSPGETLPEMPPFNIRHAAMDDVLSTQIKPQNQQDKIGKKFVTGPLEVSYTIELKEPRFKGELKEIYAENETQTPPPPPPTGTCILPNGKNLDLNGDGTVDIGDAVVLINNWDAQGGPADLNGDGTVDISDAVVLINNWDKQCT